MGNLRVILPTMALVTILLTCGNVTSALSEEGILSPRVPSDKLAAVKDWKNLVPPDERSVALGKEIYFSRGACVSCHGNSGKGDGPVAASFDPKPRDFTDTKWQDNRTDGEIFWAITEGTEFGMIGFGGNLDEHERWSLVNYIRSLGEIKNGE